MMRGSVVGTGLFLTSLTLLLSELVLTRIFSVTLGNHFAFLVISIAIFGLSLAGVVVYVMPDRFPAAHLAQQAATFSSLVPVSLLLVLSCALILPIGASSSLRDVTLMGILYLTASAPFFLGGLVIVLILTHHSSNIGRLYFVDLLGAASGALLVIPIVNTCGAPTALLIAGIVAAVAAMIFGTQAPRSDTKMLQRLLPFAGLTGLGLLGFGLIGERAIRIFARRMFHSDPIYSTRGNPFDYYYSLFRLDINQSLTGLAIFGFLLFAGSTAAFIYSRRASGGVLLCALVTLCLAISATGVNLYYQPLRVRYAKGQFQFPPIFERWNTYSRVAVFRNESNRVGSIGWGVSPMYTGPLPEHLAMDIDAGASTPLIRVDGDLRAPGLQHLGYDVTSLVYQVRPEAHTLVIGSGGGRDVLSALYFGSPSVTAIEINPIIADVVNRHFADFTGKLYQHPKVSLVVDEGRSFVRRTRDKYGVIQLSLIDTYASTAAGAHALSENSLYTVEALSDLLNHLESNGVLSISRWLFKPMRETLRIVSMARASLSRVLDSTHHIDYSRHIVVIASPEQLGLQVATVLVKREPFSDLEVAKLVDTMERLHFIPVAVPGIGAPNAIRGLIESTRPEAFYAEYPYDIRPSTDDRPFFFNTMKPGHYLSLWKNALPGQQASRLTAWLFIIILILVIGLMALPMTLIRGGDTRGLRVASKASYFAAIGLGFILVEISLIELLTFYLGHPIYSLVVVISSLLLFAGFGARVTQWLKPAQIDRLGRWFVGTLVVLLLGYALWAPGILRLTVGEAFGVRAAITVALLCPIALLMGTALPCGIRRLEQGSAPLIPWMWAVNGAMTVLGSVLAIALSMNVGITATLMVGVIAYSVALIVIPGRSPNNWRVGPPHSLLVRTGEVTGSGDHA
jgi:spermidine synthase